MKKFSKLAVVMLLGALAAGAMAGPGNNGADGYHKLQMQQQQSGN